MFGFLAGTASVPDSAACLRVEGTFENVFYKDDEPCAVVIARDGCQVDTVVLSKARKKFRYNFRRGSMYSLRVIKAGFVPLVIDVDTKMAERDDVLYRFEFTTRLITEKRGRTFNQQALLLPLAIISYSRSSQNFQYDQEYTESLKLKMVLNSGIQFNQPY
jgi:hypothetical protein